MPPINPFVASSETSKPEVVFDYAKVKRQVDVLLTDWKSVVNTGGVTVTDTGCSEC